MCGRRRSADRRGDRWLSGSVAIAVASERRPGGDREPTSATTAVSTSTRFIRLMPPDAPSVEHRPYRLRAPRFGRGSPMSQAPFAERISGELAQRGDVVAQRVRRPGMHGRFPRGSSIREPTSHGTRCNAMRRARGWSRSCRPIAFGRRLSVELLKRWSVTVAGSVPSMPRNCSSRPSTAAVSLRNCSVESTKIFDAPY